MATLPSASTCLSNESAAARSQGVKLPFTIERTFNLATLLAAVIANADVVNLFELPANHVIIASSLKTSTAGTKDATTFTLQLRHGTTAIGPALDATAVGTGVGANATYSLPATVGASAVKVNLVAVVSGGNAVATANPTVKVKLVVADMS